MKVLFDQHVHTYRSIDSEVGFEDYIELAIKNGQDYFVCTDHFDFDYVRDGNNWFFDIKDETNEIKKLQNKYQQIKLLQGIEIGYKKERLQEFIDIVSNNKFDIINLSIHDINHIDFYQIATAEKVGVRPLMELYYKTILDSVLTFPEYDVVCHIDYGFKTVYRYNNSYKLEDFEDLVVPVLKAIIRKDKALEINTKVQMFLPDEHLIYLLNLYKKLGGVNLTLSSDAHTLDRYKDKFDHYIEIIKKAGFDHLNYYINRVRYDFKLD